MIRRKLGVRKVRRVTINELTASSWNNEVKVDELAVTWSNTVQPYAGVYTAVTD